MSYNTSLTKQQKDEMRKLMNIDLRSLQSKIDNLYLLLKLQNRQIMLIKQIDEMRG